jgi:hypothetical protein
MVRAGEIELAIGERFRTATDPAFNLQIAADPKYGPSLQATGPGESPHMAVVGPNETFLLIHEDNADWHFITRPIPGQSGRFHTTIYKDELRPYLTGIAWSQDGSRIFTWEISSQDEALLVLSRRGDRWIARRYPARPHSAQNVELRQVSADGRTVRVNLGNEPYQCSIAEQRAACQKLASEKLSVRRGEQTFTAHARDWYCPLR